MIATADDFVDTVPLAVASYQAARSHETGAAWGTRGAGGGAPDAIETPVLPARRSWLGRLVSAIAARWPSARKQIPRDLLIVLWLAILANGFGVAWVMTDSVHTSAALVIKGAPVRPGELAVFGYSGSPLPLYYDEDDIGLWLRRMSGNPASRDGPRRGDGFVKYLVGVPGDRIEVVGREVFLHTRTGRIAVGTCKPATRRGVALAPIAPQVIPDGYGYMWAPHADALDSRYAHMGLVPLSAIVGRAVRLW